MQEIIKEELTTIVDRSTDELIDKLDINEDAVDHLRLALKAWIKSDLGKREARVMKQYSRKSARTVGRTW